MPLAVEMNSLLPEGWCIHNIINLEPGWQVNISDGEWIVVATGEDIEDALALANTKTLDETQYTGRLASLPRLRASKDLDPSIGSILAGLIGRPEAKPVRRR